jgi:hypothetical protein
MVLPQNGYFWAQINHAELPFLHVLNPWRPKNQNFNFSALEGPKHQDFARHPPFSRADPDVCPEPRFSRAKRPFLSTHPDKVCEGFLAQISGMAKNVPEPLFSRTKRPSFVNYNIII